MLWTGYWIVWEGRTDTYRQRGCFCFLSAFDCDVRWPASSTCLTFLLLGTVIWNHKPNKSFSPPHCFCQIISTEQEQNEDSVHCMFIPRVRLLLFLCPPEAPPSLMNPLWLTVAVDLLIVLIISDPGQFSRGQSHYSGVMASKWKEVQREGRGGVCEITALEKWRWCSYTVPERESTFPFSLCRTLLPG